MDEVNLEGTVCVFISEILSPTENITYPQTLKWVGENFK